MFVVILCGSLVLITGLILSVLGFNLGVEVAGFIANFQVAATGPAGLVLLGGILQWIGAGRI